MSNTEIHNRFNVWAFRAIDENEICKEYIKGHVKVLADYGITSITSNNNLWTTNQNMYCVVVEDSVTKELLGGIRIQIADGTLPLPVEVAVGFMDNRIYDIVKDHAFNGGAAELCGFWVANKLRGVGMGPILVRASIASLNQLHLVTLFGICGINTLSMFNNAGFVIDHSLGKNGGFPYPTDDLTAHVIGILNAITLETASSFDKEIMTSLRERPVMKRTEKNNNFISEISYNLLYKNISINHYGVNSGQKKII
ncbi:MAG: hypothetical protein Q7W45_02335 [Bacteroidota bacterium]|nr:hypothetical protein [Bacteroidota bacterium]MDP3145910.1 hypothetical protein [Bacteroidota bacterium]